MSESPSVVVHLGGPQEVRHLIEATGLILRDEEVLFMLDDQIVARWPSADVERVEWPRRAQTYTLAEKRLENPQAYARWTEEEEVRLRQAYEAGVPIDELAERHARNAGAIRSRLQRLGLDTGR